MKRGRKITTWSKRMKMNWKPSLTAIRRMAKGARSPRARKIAARGARMAGAYR